MVLGINFSFKVVNPDNNYLSEIVDVIFYQHVLIFLWYIMIYLWNIWYIMISPEIWTNS